MKTAEELFNDRLRETGLIDKWEGTGRVAVEQKNSGIVLFVHEDENDNYSEIHYPTFDRIRYDREFSRRCFSDLDGLDDKLFRKLGLWLTGVDDECPLEPEDIYFTGDHLKTYYRNFIDEGITPVEYFKERMGIYAGVYSPGVGKIKKLNYAVKEARNDVRCAFPMVNEAEWDFSFNNALADISCRYLGDSVDYQFVILDRDGDPKQTGDILKKTLVYLDMAAVMNDFVCGVDSAIMTVREYCKVFNVNILDIAVED